MTNPAGKSNDAALRLDFDRRLMLQFRGSVVTWDAGLLAYRELDDALGLSAIAGQALADARTGKNGRHALAGLFRQSVFGRLAGYEDVNDQNGCAMIRRCAGSSAARRLKALRLRRARWAASQAPPVASTAWGVRVSRVHAKPTGEVCLDDTGVTADIARRAYEHIGKAWSMASPSGT